MDDERKALGAACMDMARELVLDCVPPLPGMSTDDIRQRAFGSIRPQPYHSMRRITRHLLEQLEREGRVVRPTRAKWARAAPACKQPL